MNTFALKPKGTKARGRFAPSPTGRMHLGNIYAALMSWLSVKSKGGDWVLRIEDLDQGRSRAEYARLIEDDLQWFGLQWDEGGLDDKGKYGPYSQSRRNDLYCSMFMQLPVEKMVYACRCRRADLLASQAPHRSDGRVVYGGRCRPLRLGGSAPDDVPYEGAALRLWVPDADVRFKDMVYGEQCSNLAADCGDFIIRRADGGWAYQFAVVADDALMGITEVVRGNDLLLSSAQQIYLSELFGYEPPQFGHLPLLCNPQGQRLSKRDQSLSMEQLRKRFTPGGLLGYVAYIGGLTPSPDAVELTDLLDGFRFPRAVDSIIVSNC